ncbi:MAG: lysophospholipid acyltransferase family protein [Thermodesulfobacteriota bacterium]
MKLRFDHPLWRRNAPALARRLLQAYLLTCPCKLVVSPEVEKLIISPSPVIYTTWHCHLLSPLFFARRYRGSQLPMVLMASPSRDGEFIAEVARGLGFIVLSGSRRKGGVQTLRQMGIWFNRGHSCGMIADGSRGPARVAQKGPLYLARETQGLILPLAVAASRKVTFNTWDRFELPLPGSRLTLLMGEPFRVRTDDRGPALEARRLELEAHLNRLFFQSQSYYPPRKKN